MVNLDLQSRFTENLSSGSLITYCIQHLPCMKMTTALARLRTIATTRRLACITAWDYPSGLLAESAEIDLVLVGDSLGITALGYKDTKAVTLDEIVHHTRAVARAYKTGFLLADLPLGSYEKSTEHGKVLSYAINDKVSNAPELKTDSLSAIESAIKLVKEGGAHGVKLEGGRDMAPAIRAISKAGVPVIGHIGLTLQRDLDASKEVDDGSEALEDAKSVQDAGAVAVVVEAVASGTADTITKTLRIPTIGIGYGFSRRIWSLTNPFPSSGPHCSGQLALQTEILGFQKILFPE